MTQLYTPVWAVGEGYNVERNYSKWLILQWLPGCMVSAGNPYVIRENVFGGYEVHIRLKPSFHAANSGGWRHDNILLDYYATAPGDPTPINAGTVQRAYLPQQELTEWAIIFGQAGGTDRLWCFRLPTPATSPFFAPVPDTYPDRFCLQLPDVTTILPMPSC